MNRLKACEKTEIREMRRDGIKLKKIAEKFNVSQSEILKIVYRRNSQ